MDARTTPTVGSSGGSPQNDADQVRDFRMTPAERRERWFQRHVDTQPPLSEAQRERVAALLPRRGRAERS
jgi:hypothetical protein